MLSIVDVIDVENVAPIAQKTAQSVCDARPEILSVPTRFPGPSLSKNRETSLRILRLLHKHVFHDLTRRVTDI